MLWLETGDVWEKHVMHLIIIRVTGREREREMEREGKRE